MRVVGIMLAKITVILCYLILVNMVKAGDDINRYIAYRLWGYANNNLSNAGKNSYQILDANREEDIYSLVDLLGTPFDSPYARTLDVSLFEKIFDEKATNGETQISWGAGNKNLYNFSLVTGGVIAEGPFSIMAAINAQSSDGFKNNLFLENDKIARTKNSAQRLRINYESIDFSSSFQYSNLNHKQGDNTLRLSELPNRVSYSDLAGFENFDDEVYNLDLEWRIDEAWTVKSTTVDTTENIRVLQDIDRTFLPLEMFLYGSNGDIFNQNIRFEYLNAEGELLALQVKYKKTKNKDAAITTGLLLAPLINVPVTLSILSNQQVEQWETTLSKDWRLSKKSYFSAELNYLNYSLKRKELVIGSTNGLVDTGGLRRVTTVDKVFDQFLPQLFYNYELQNGNALYFELGQQYQPGGVSLNLVNGIRRPYAEEIESRFEVGLNDSSSIENISFSVDYFYSDFKNKQVPVFGSRDNIFDVGIINALAASSSGLGIDLEYAKDETFSIKSNLLWQQTEYKSFKPFFSSLTGKQFIATPKLQVTTSFVWKFLPNFIVSLEQIYQGSKFSDAPNEKVDKLGSRNIINIKLGYEQKNWALYLWGANITNQQFLTYKSTLSDIAVAGIAASYGVTLESKF